MFCSKVALFLVSDAYVQIPYAQWNMENALDLWGKKVWFDNQKSFNKTHTPLQKHHVLSYIFEHLHLYDLKYLIISPLMFSIFWIS